MGYTVWRNQLRLRVRTTFRAAFGRTPGSLYRWGLRQARRRRWTCGNGRARVTDCPGS
jgi:hypothetical protein